MVARRQEWEHGTVFGYDKRSCRCDACRLARRTYDQERYARIADSRKAQVEVWRDANREKARSYTRAQYHRDPVGRKAAQRAWALANPEKQRAREARYRASERGRLKTAQAEHKRRGAVTDEWTNDYIAILLKDPCSYCGGSGGTIDHIIPVSKGGTSEWDNLTAACGSCNSSKRDADLMHFLYRKAS